MAFEPGGLTDPTAAARWLKASRREYLMRDFFTFAKHSGYCPDITEEDYRDICDWLEGLLPPSDQGVKKRTDQQFGIFLIPRKTYKSTLINALIAYALIRDRNLRTILGRATLDMAKQSLMGVRQGLTLYPDLRDAFGDVVTTAESWTTTEVRLSGRTIALREPSIDTVGLETSRTGAHPDLVILDDLVHEGNFQSEVQTEKAKMLIQSYYPILESGGTLLLVGTRWADNDIYGWLLEKDQLRIDAGRPAQYQKYIAGAYREDGTARFPTALSTRMLERLRESTETKMFTAWYLNEPRTEGERIFPQERLRYCEGEFYPGAIPQFVPAGGVHPALAALGTRIPLYVVMTCDPAPTVGPKSDFTGITVTGFGPEESIIALHAEGIKMLPHDRLQHLMYLVHRYEPHILALENADIDAVLLQDRIDAAGLRTRVHGFNPRTDRKALMRDDMRSKSRTSKEAQIESLEPFLHQMWFVRGKTEQLTAQMVQYPYLNHDDVLDAFSFARFFRRDFSRPHEDLEALYWRYDEEKEQRELAREAYAVESPPFHGIARGGLLASKEVR